MQKMDINIGGHGQPAVTHPRKTLENTEKKETVSDNVHSYSGRLVSQVTPYLHHYLQRTYSFLTGQDHQILTPDALQIRDCLREQREKSQKPDCLVELLSNAEVTSCSPTLKKKIISALNLSKKEIEIPDAYQMNSDKFMFGEEFEYWAPKTEGRDSWWAVHDLLNIWEEKIKDKLWALDIPEFEFSIKKHVWPEDYPNKHMRGICTKVDVKIGNWHCKAFRDSWKFEGLLEFNASPYRLDQTFQVNGKIYTPYELFDLFIFSICKTMNIKPSSGHKHVDLYDSVGGNTELLFRLLIDVEDKAWLCSAFDRELYSSTAYQFVTQDKDATQRVQNLEKIISIYNSLLKEGYTPERGDFHEAIPSLISFWENEIGSDNRFHPVNIPKPIYGEDNEKAKSGQIVSKPKSVTAEFRFFNTPRDGNEVKILNEFLSEWFKLLNKKQIDRSSVEYTSYNPDHPQPKEKTAEMLEHFCTQELELPFNHHKHILRI